MSRIDQYLRYHRASATIGDIDPGHAMLRYVCDRFELSMEQRFWLAWLFSMSYCGASSFYCYNEFPDFENVDVGRMNRWWSERGRQEIICQTDRRWVRSSSQFVPAFESYRNWIGASSQADHFSKFSVCTTPERRYDMLLESARQLYSFGQFSLFLYLEALHTITDLDLCPTDLDLEKAWSCRQGLYYAYELDHLIDDGQTPIRPGAHEVTAEKWSELRETLGQLAQPPTVWNTETVLCAFRKYHRGKRWIGSYLDRQAIEIAKMEQRVKSGVCWDVLWQYRIETYDQAYLAEHHGGVDSGGLSRQWKNMTVARTRDILEAA